MKLRENPYAPGMPVYGRNFVGRDNILKVVQNREGGCVLINAPFRWGKSSILYEAESRLGSDNAVFTSLAAISRSEYFLNAIFRRGSGLNETPGDYQKAKEKFRELDHQLQVEGKFKYFFVDEFTGVPYMDERREAAETLMFLADLRGLTAIKFVFAVHPHGVRKICEIYPEFLNGAEHHLVGPLSVEDVGRLIALSEEQGLQVSPEARDAIIKESGRIAIFVQILLFRAFDNAKGDIIRGEDINDSEFFDCKHGWIHCLTPQQRDILRIVLKNPNICGKDIPNVKGILSETRTDLVSLPADLDLLGQNGFGILIMEGDGFDINGEILRRWINDFVSREEEIPNFDYLKI